jgi:hypothetical protein
LQNYYYYYYIIPLCFQKGEGRCVHFGICQTTLFFVKRPELRRNYFIELSLIGVLSEPSRAGGGNIQLQLPPAISPGGVEPG